MSPVKPTAAAIICANAEALRAPIGWRAFEGISPAYQEVAQLPNAVIVEMPFPPPPTFFVNTDYMLASTVHWRPMVNGYSGLLPDSYRRLWRDGITRFPDPSSTDALRAIGVTHVIVHTSRLRGGARMLPLKMQRSGEFERVGGKDVLQIFRLRPRESQEAQ